MKSAYILLQEAQNSQTINQQFCLVSSRIWHCDVPSKISIFAWRLLQSRLPTRDMLLSRGVLNANSNISCVFCSRESEDTNHLFFSCDFSYHVWMTINRWTGAMGLMQNSGYNHFLQFADVLKGKKHRRGRHIIWMAVVWVLWLTRNDVIFKQQQVDLIDVVAKIKIFSWNWFVNRKGRHSGILYSEWCSNPLGCISIS